MFTESSRARVGLLVVMSPQTDYNTTPLRKGQKEKGQGQRCDGKPLSIQFLTFCPVLSLFPFTLAPD
jgi:hypothetical protein